MKTYLLDEILGAIARAVSGVNQALHQQQGDLYAEQMFQDAGDGVLHPRTRKIVLPRNHVEPGQAAEGIHEVPEAALSNHSRVSIDNLVMEFDCLVEGLEQKDQAPSLSLVIGSTMPRRANPARLRITFRHTDTPEGVAEVNDQLLKKF